MLVTLVLFLPCLSISQILKNDSFDTSQAFKSLFKHISNSYFNNGITLIIFHKNGLSDIPENVAKIVSNSHPTQISNIHYEKPEWFYLMFLMDSGRADNIVVILEGLDVEKALLMFREQALWNSQAKILLIIECYEFCQSEAGSALKTIWDVTRALNVVIMTLGKSIQFFSCAHYTNCGFQFQELDTEKNNFFPNKIPKNFESHVLTIATTVKEPYILGPKKPLEYTEGVEIQILSLIAKRLNFEIKYKESPNGESPYLIYDKAGKRIGLLGILYRQEADLACFGTGLGNDRYYAADALISHTQDTLVWMAPVPGPRSNWDSVYIAFSADIWILVLVILITIAITLRFLSTNSEDVLIFSNFSKCVLDSWSATLNLGITNSPKSEKMKLFLTFVFVYAVIISSAYQSFLITFLTSQRRGKGYDSIEEAVDDGIVAYIFPSGMYMYNQSKHEMWNKILAENGHVLDTSYNYTKTLSIVEKPPFAVSLMIRYSAEFIVRKYFLRHSGALVKTLSPYFTTYPITFYMAPGHPLRHIFNENVARLIEAGLPDKWLKDVLQDAEDRDYNKEGDNDSLRKSLSLSHLEVTFLILGSGLTISLISFTLEVIMCPKTRGKTL